MSKINIWWARRDLRLSDNQALQRALAAGEQVLPVFVIDPQLVEGPNASAKRLEFLWGGLRALDASLQALGSRLIVRRGDVLAVLQSLLAESGAGAIFAEQDFSPYARQRDGRAGAQLPLRLVAGLNVHAPGTILKADGSPYSVYTAFMKAWKLAGMPGPRQVLPTPERIETPTSPVSDPLPAGSAEPGPGFPPGEAEAQRRLQAFACCPDSPIYAYGIQRDRPDLNGTSALSPYLRFGMLSARQAVVSALVALESAADEAGRRSAETWLNELIWREFYQAILFHFPGVLRQSYRPETRSIRWRNRPEEFAAWQVGQTGYPIVDAAMRQLLATGWMHNRLRMITASFLTKDLLIDWRWGQRWFMRHLIDGDPAANNGGWQWTAGTGTDAAPYFRVFNPVLQAKKFDPQGDFVRRWLPELANVPRAYVHEPWLMPATVQHQAGCLIGVDYPAPIVDHAQARQAVLSAYATAKQRA